MPEPDRHESQPAPEDTGVPVDRLAVRDRAEVVAATVHGRGITRDDGCAACVLARRDVPALLDLLAAARRRARAAERERDRLREVRVDLIGTLDRIAERDPASRDEIDAARDSEFDVCVNCDSVEIAVAAGVRHGEARGEGR